MAPTLLHRRDDNYFNAGAIAGIAIFGFAVLLTIMNVAFFLWHRRQKRKAMPEEYRRRPSYHPFRSQSYSAVPLTSDAALAKDIRRGSDVTESEERKSSMFSRERTNSSVSTYQAYNPIESDTPHHVSRNSSSPLIPVQIHPPSPPAPAARAYDSRRPSITPLTLDSTARRSQERARSSSNVSLNRYYNGEAFSGRRLSAERTTPPLPADARQNALHSNSADQERVPNILQAPQSPPRQ